MKNILLYIWQLPQNLIGLIILVWGRLSKNIQKVVDLDNGVKVYYAKNFTGGISLGKYIFIHDLSKFRQIQTELHEYGHTCQSRVLGWFYLLIIGLPSIFHAMIYKFDPKNPYGYYDFYTESWADKLGGVKR